MKKLLLSLLLLPMMAFGATTNKLDNILNTGTFQRPTGAGVGNIWTSDAAGFGGWSLPASVTGPYAVTNGSNFYTPESTNRFNASTFITGTLVLNSNLFTNPVAYHSVDIFPLIGQIHNFVNVKARGAGQPRFTVANSNGKAIAIDMSGDRARLSAADGAVELIVTAPTSVLIEAPSIVFGNNSASTETHVGITDTRPNGWLVNGFAPATVIVTNIQANFPSILAASFADLTFPVSNTSSNMVVSIGRPTAEEGSLAVNAFISAIGTVTLRARNVGSIAVDQADLPYRIQITASPTANSP